MKRVLVMVLVTLFIGCSGGDWVDAPSTCLQLSGEIDIWNLNVSGEYRVTKTGDPTADFEALIDKMRGLDATDDQIAQFRKKMDNTLTMASRALCSSIGKSYTGDWECTADHQRIKCK